VEGTGRRAWEPADREQSGCRGRLCDPGHMQAFYSIRSERQLVERIDHDLLFRWFVGLGIEDAVWDATTFTKNRDRLLEGEVARRRTVARQGQKAAVERVLFDYAILGTEALRARPGFQQRAVRASRPAPKNLSNKIARGRFTAAFFMQCMRAIGCRIIHLDADE